MDSVTLEEKLAFLENAMTIVENRLTEKEKQMVEEKKNHAAESYEIARIKWAEYIQLKKMRIAADKANQIAEFHYKAKSREHSLLLQQVPFDVDAAKKSHDEQLELEKTKSNTTAEKHKIEIKLSLLIGKEIDQVNEGDLFSKQLLDAANEADMKYKEALSQFPSTSS